MPFMGDIHVGGDCIGDLRPAEGIAAESASHKLISDGDIPCHPWSGNGWHWKGHHRFPDGTESLLDLRNLLTIPSLSFPHPPLFILLICEICG